ncbi:hypothetical protein [Actinoplanes sp. NPDC020271]|uniref:hypothetical protein n=1 Tax=Actinoplanes sp. NPDC020271 TaxID=3363896 RepID=UPI0037ADB7AB
MGWFGVRAVFAFDLGERGVLTYEERVTLWQAESADAARELAGRDAAEYARCLDGCEFTGLLQAGELPEEPGHGAEVFALMRDSALPPDKYVAAFFDTGWERRGISDGE